MSYFGKFFLGGPRATEAAEWLMSARVPDAAGRVTYTCLLNASAGIEADLTVSRLEDGHFLPALNPLGGGYYLAASGGSAGHVLAHVKSALQDEGFREDDAKLLDLSGDLALLSLQGPKSRSARSTISMIDRLFALRIILQLVAPSTDWSDEAFPVYAHKVIDILGFQASQPCLLRHARVKRTHRSRLEPCASVSWGNSAGSCTCPTTPPWPSTGR